MEFQFEIDSKETENFSDFGVQFGKSAGLRIEGPQARPGKSADNYILVLRGAGDFHVTIDTDSERGIGTADFYCARSINEKNANIQLQNMIKEFTLFASKHMGNKKVQVSSMKSNKWAPIWQGLSNSLDANHIQAAASCDT